MNILLMNVRITAVRNTDAMMNVERLAKSPLPIEELPKYMNSIPQTKPTIRAVIAPACSKTTCMSFVLIANTITGILMLVLRIAKAT
jgi:hypothetical protein